jgi:hypothetical protein
VRPPARGTLAIGGGVKGGRSRASFFTISIRKRLHPIGLPCCVLSRTNPPLWYWCIFTACRLTSRPSRGSLPVPTP